VISREDLLAYWGGKTVDELEEALHGLDDSYWGGVCDEWEWGRVRAAILEVTAAKAAAVYTQTKRGHDAD
jgi:hypothetical protein